MTENNKKHIIAIQGLDGNLRTSYPREYKDNKCKHRWYPMTTGGTNFDRGSVDDNLQEIGRYCIVCHKQELFGDDDETEKEN